ncbi:hypothetical protein GQ53DRAFT_797139 [Thozetella sp. PMI_491]|nr:hypothetical protein GQ53DRAFT_797139 [Thozetella sp. PMI_491]
MSMRDSVFSKLEKRFSWPVVEVAAYNDKYVLHYELGDVDPAKATEELKELLLELEAVGLSTEVRVGYDESLLIFVKAPKELLGNCVHKARVKDWLYGVVPIKPKGNSNTVVDGKFEAEDLLSLYHLITWPKDLGGAGITPDLGRWKNVKSLFPVHNPATNHDLLRHLSRRFFLRVEDLDQIRDLFGAKVAFYFAFTQTYILALLFPSITGLLAWLFLPQYSLVYAILTGLWCTVFLEYWKIQETDLSIRWEVNGVGRIKINRPQFKYEKVFVDDFGRTIHYFPKWKAIARQMLQIPFVLMSLFTLGALIIIVFTIEVMIVEEYEGPYKWYLEYLPTILLAIAIPYISQFLENVAEFVTEFENHRTKDNHEMSRTQKIFVLNFITNYLPIFLTAFVYVPFGDYVIPYLETILHHVVRSSREFMDMSFQADPNRLRNQVIALTLTGQVSHFGEEFLFPFIMQSVRRWYNEYRSDRVKDAFLRELGKDHPEDLAFLSTVRNQSTLEPYNVQEDISQMVIQFGYLALFSPVWPLVPIGFLLNNWFELRSDFLKICIEHQRPTPERTDGIGPWIHSLAFLNWLGSISTAAVVHLFGANALGYVYDVSSKDVWWTLPITIFVSEHVFLLLRSVVQFSLQRIGSQQIRRQRNEEYARRKNQLEEYEANKNSVSLLTVDQRRMHRKKSVQMNREPFFTRQAEEGKSFEVTITLIKALKPNAKGGKED